MKIKLHKVETKKALKSFISLPAQIYLNNKLWVPPFYYSHKKYFDKKNNKSFSFSDTVMALAYKNEKVVGRIMGIINHRHNEYCKEKKARFTFFDCYYDEDVASVLLNYIENWAKKKGMTKLIGPMGFSVREPEGALIEGFEFEPTLGTNYNFQYIPRFLQENNFQKEIDYVVYKIPVQRPLFSDRILERIKQKGEYELLEIKQKAQMVEWASQVQILMNDTFSQFYGYYPISTEEMNYWVRSNLVLLDPKFVKAIMKNGKMIAFIVAMPNINQGIRRANGRLLPFGYLHLKRAVKKSKQLDLLLGAIDKKYRGIGLDVVLADAMIRSAMEAGFEFMDSSPELENNKLIRAEMEKHGGEIYKRYRLFCKNL